MNRLASNVAEKLVALSPEQLSTVDQFVEFLRLRGQDQALTQAATAASEPAFAAVWNNPEDDVYDAI